MINYLLKVLALLVFASLVIGFYYIGNQAHVEKFDGYLIYIVIVGLIYAIYKYIQVEFGEGKATFTPAKLVGFFLIQLFVVSGLFFQFNELELTRGAILFFKVLGYLIIPVVILTISTAFGHKIFKYITKKYALEEDTKIFNFIASFGIGFLSFLFLVDTLGMIGSYNLVSVAIILGGFAIFSYKEIIGLFHGFFHHKIHFDVTEGNYLKLISAEVFFIVGTLILSTSLVNVMRPFPIGWDDLGAYMNFPHLLAVAGDLKGLGGMYAWQSFTGIGFMLESPVQAFVLNNVGGIMSFIVLILVTSDLLGSKINKISLHLPLLISTIFIAMPMVVFQQAKDMKLDAGLFFVSVITLYLFYKYLISEKKNISLLFIVGLLAGLAFAIKFTTLLFISALIGVIFYSRLGFLGFVGYLSIYFSIFTKGGLWGYMNVVYPKENLFLINSFSLVTFLLGSGILFHLLFKDSRSFKKVLLKLGVFILGVLLALTPWLAKNIYTSFPNLSVGSILGGTTDHFQADYLKIHSQEDLDAIHLQNTSQGGRGITSSGTTQNEDYGRYFGYEKGINNYVKLPFNLTMQTNQGGEFTDIGYLFLAFLPGILLFLPYRRKEYAFGAVGLMGFNLLAYMNPSTRDIFTGFFNQFNLPGGYGVVLLGFLAPLLYLLCTLKESSKSKLMHIFRLNLVFTTFYTFLWSISAFGIVWYGIVMYFNFLLIIGIGIYYVSTYKDDEDKKSKQIKLFGSLVVFGIVLIYILNSVMPHTFNNLKDAAYKEYKMGQMTSAEGIFKYHSEYLPILFELNIQEEKKNEFIKKYVGKNIQNTFPMIVENNITIEAVVASLNDIIRLKTKSDLTPSEAKIVATLRQGNLFKEAEVSLQKIYSNIANPDDEFKNNIGIYRIGTFLKFFISENNTRLLEDSLITQFDTYLYNENVDTSVENIKKLGLGYLLVDLNAATIDKDTERHALTKRFEKLFKTFSSSHLELVETDSLCLKLALEEYNTSEKTEDDLNKFLEIGGVNYESYTSEGVEINRQEKQYLCTVRINELMLEGKVDATHYSFLQLYKDALDRNNITDKTERLKAIFQFTSNSYKVLFKVK